MNIRHALAGIALVVATATITTQVVSQEKKGGKAPEMPQMSPEDAAMMQKWQEFATPNEHHKALDFKAGKWTNEVSFWMDPAAPPQVSQGTSEYKWIMDGRYMVEDHLGTVMGQPFHGHGATGYDNLKKKYVSVWLDNMGTGIMYGEGTYDEKTKTFSSKSESPDVVSGKYVPTRGVEKIVDNDHWVMEMYGPDKTGKEFKTMEIRFTRAK